MSEKTLKSWFPGISSSQSIQTLLINTNCNCEVILVMTAVFLITWNKLTFISSVNKINFKHLYIQFSLQVKQTGFFLFALI